MIKDENLFENKNLIIFVQLSRTKKDISYTKMK